MVPHLVAALLKASITQQCRPLTGALASDWAVGGLTFLLLKNTLGSLLGWPPSLEALPHPILPQFQTWLPFWRKTLPVDYLWVRNEPNLARTGVLVTELGLSSACACASISEMATSPGNAGNMNVTLYYSSRLVITSGELGLGEGTHGVRGGGLRLQEGRPGVTGCGQGPESARQAGKSQPTPSGELGGGKE